MADCNAFQVIEFLPGGGRMTRPVPTVLVVQTKFVGRLPDAPTIVGHVGVTVAKRTEGIPYRVRKTRHATDMGVFAHALGADLVVRAGVTVWSVS